MCCYKVKRFDDLKMELRNRDATIHKLKEELKRMQFVAKKIKDLTMEKEAQIKTISEQVRFMLRLQVFLVNIIDDARTWFFKKKKSH